MDDIECPYCFAAYTADDTWEADGYEHDYECDYCHSLFTYTAYISVDWGTAKKKKNPGLTL